MTQGTKHDTGKPMVALVPQKALLEVAKVMTYGATKYKQFNWKQGLTYLRLYSATMRHMIAWHSGENSDPETGISHIAHACCNLLMLCEFETEQRSNLDDRYKEKTV